ncbi:LRR receptor-like serine/threonine-protein kinase RPK2 [Lactuca sativa]|uniref:non-specific serine/threonine protein kinase n=1 Tax=Lactuca sativa TaxID=4236 RepID=A0A9R1VUG0_LACSA|nr:LRR receptor-like serine/threonine-protein kinase RPK2 [Lactuca sativa]KAJ0212746.1 hypothetical protein LSAT_V11C400222900 [Lactuca sativa]
MGRLHKPFNFLLITLLVFTTSYFHAVSGDDSDKSALLEFKAAVSDLSGVLMSWNLSSSDHCSWIGVTCGSDSRVVAINITGGGNSGDFTCSKYNQFPLYGFGIVKNCLDLNAKLVGNLSSAISKLSELRILSLPFNDLSGEIPSEIWGMEKLEVIDLEGNSIHGNLQSHFTGLKSLRVLNLGFNQISGEIPNSVSQFKNLQVLNLAGNHINGSIPIFLDKFGDLRGLYLSFNQLSGNIPIEIGYNCGNLENLELAGNLLVGGIPSSLGNCTKLQSLLLYSNLLQEEIPIELGRLKTLQVLDISRNSLSGPIPRELGSCLNLSIVVFSNLFNPIPTFSIPDNNFLQLAPEDEFNYFEGTIPSEITTLPNLKLLWAPRATLEGRFPDNWGTCGSLEMINLAQNLFSGEIPKGFNICKNLNFLDLSSNKLTGEISDKLRVPCMTVFDVSSNHLSGSIPSFHNTTCEPLNPSSTYLQFFASKTVNSLFLPTDNRNLAVIHNIGNNNFTGGLSSIPISRTGENTVYAFLAGENALTGEFPGVLFENCAKLKGLVVNVSSNGLSGQIPVNIGQTCRILTFLDLSGNRISGTIPVGFGDLDSLVSVNLSRNMLSGEIPGSFDKIKDLKNLSLSGNNLTGRIPSGLGDVKSLQVLELSSNSLSGEIPEDLVNLKNLTVLLLNNNKLSGKIPSGLANVKTLQKFNVSFNNLSGPLPSNENLMKCSSLLGNPYLQSCKISPATSSPEQPVSGDFSNLSGSPIPGPKDRNRNGFSSIEIASITSASAIFSVMIALFVLFCCTKWRPKSAGRGHGSTRKEVTVFTDIGVPVTFENVVRATGSFNASNCIGNGGFGATYKAEISPGFLVAIKRLAVGRFQGVQQFDAEIKTLGRLRHPNLVTLIGYHASETEMFLIYNYLPGGNLERFIQERSIRAVDWRVLHKIALDIARALAYLHDQCVPRVLHRDVKPSNILLDEDFNAYLSDFGLARLLGTSETHATTGVAGTFGYVAPEYAMTCRVSDKADVYSYGVVLLELISDKKALDPSFSSYGNGFNIVGWACMLLRQGRAKEFFTGGLWDAGPHDDLVEVLHLAVVCTVDSLSTRPTMKQVVRRLKQLQPPSC